MRAAVLSCLFLCVAGTTALADSSSVLMELDTFNRAARECTVFLMNQPEFQDLKSRTPICQEAMLLRRDLLQKGFQVGYDNLAQ
jgi:hypothetical protein